jgi:hypothetical protein
MRKIINKNEIKMKSENVSQVGENEYWERTRLNLIESTKKAIKQRKNEPMQSEL